MQDLYLYYCHLCINHFYFHSLAVVSMLSNPQNWIICFKSKFALVDLLFRSDPKNGTNQKRPKMGTLPKTSEMSKSTILSLSYVIDIRAWNSRCARNFGRLLNLNAMHVAVLKISSENVESEPKLSKIWPMWPWNLTYDLENQ